MHRAKPSQATPATPAAPVPAAVAVPDVHPLAKNRRFTWRKEPVDARDHLFVIPAAHAKALKSQKKSKKSKTPVPPATFDMRPRMPPVYDQGNLGSCTANATDGAYEYNEIIENHPNPAFLPSRLFTYYNSRLIDGDPQVDGGSYCRTAVKTLSQYGACHEALWPYVEAEVLVAPPQAAYTDALSWRVASYQKVAQDLNTLKYALSITGKPIVFGFQVYSSFVTAAVAATGQVPVPNTRREQLLGGHATLLVGYTSTAFIVRNSWGVSWGAHGYFYMPFAYVTNPSLASDFWLISS